MDNVFYIPTFGSIVTRMHHADTTHNVVEYERLLKLVKEYNEWYSTRQM